MNMMKVLINQCPHGFTLSEHQKAALYPNSTLSEVVRHDRDLIASFEAGDRRGDGGSSLAAIEIPDGVHYKIVETNGYEKLYWSESEIHAASN